MNEVLKLVTPDGGFEFFAKITQSYQLFVTDYWHFAEQQTLHCYDIG